MYATEKQNRGSDCSLIVVSLTTKNNRIIHIRKAVQRIASWLSLAKCKIEMQMIS